MKLITLLLGLLVALAAEANTNKAHRAAERSLETFRQLLDEKSRGDFGFQSPEEVDEMRLEQPLRHYELSLKTLAAWKTESDITAVVDRAPSTLLFPVAAKENVRSAVQVSKAPGIFSRWKTTSYGGGKLARLYVQARETSMATTRLPASEYVALSLPELQAYFLGYPLSNQWMVVSVVNAPELRLTSGVPTTALTTLQTLGAIPRSKSHAP